MSTAAELIAKAREIRSRLRRPANAVFDEGINLRRKKTPKPLLVMRAPTPPSYPPLPTPTVPLVSRKVITVGAIVRAVADYYGDVTVKDIRSPTRQFPVVRARHMVFYLAAAHCNVSTTLIGKISGGRDHSTVIHGRDSIRDRVAAGEPATLKAVSDLEQVLYAGLDHHRSSIPAISQCDLAEPEWQGIQEQAVQPLAQGGEIRVVITEATPLPESLTGLLHVQGGVFPTGPEGTRPGQPGESLL